MNSLVVSIGRVAWGYVFLYLNFNLNINAMSLNLLPDWACYAFILAALPGLALAEKAARCCARWRGYCWPPRR